MTNDVIEYDIKLPTDVAPQSSSWIDADPQAFRGALANRGKNRAALLKWVRDRLIEGTDYGVIKNKKSLWKPGAEKVVGMLGLQVRWPDLERELDRLRNGADTIWLSCELLSSGKVMAQGAGSRALSADGGDGNKAIKMAKKSAMIDAVLNIAGLSEVFTQDIEDYDEDPTVTLSEEQQKALHEKAKEGWPDKPGHVLEALASRYFGLGHRDWRRIPAFRFADAMRQLDETKPKKETEGE